MNDGGLLTTESQPGTLEFLPDGRVLEQRGYIDAYVLVDCLNICIASSL